MGRHFDNDASSFDHEQYDAGRDFSGRGPRGGGRRRQRGGFGPGPGGWAQWGDPGSGGHRGRGPGGPGAPVPPPWLAGLFGMGRPERGRGPRVRRGDVRSAILDVLREAGEGEESPNGYQVIQRITERSGGVWKPSPGSVYPTVQQLQDEELVELDEARGRRALRLTARGARWCAEHADELAAVWAPFDRPGAGAGEGAPGSGGHADLKSEIGQVMSAVWQIVSAGSETQRAAAVDVLVEARRGLYGILADGPNPGGAEDEEPEELDDTDGTDR
ncbi:PadR family transcriptional regulator [Nocardioides sp. zg-ZUI104]|uniref:PadR family transcriptional regulator n=1 Tax=Nocardioides faecalis TaxID=2803858 RepID=UPI001BCE6D9B|nr:PadR family transcriptional regulator [Nocardioides faecalis]MBS4753081.1 PadR family transcriptional regulator [Nocardioides faecalis]